MFSQFLDNPGIYSLNRNYAAYTIERQVGEDVGFDLWDEQTVKRLLVEEPDLMPYYPPKRAVKRGIDLAWGKRQITAQITSGILQGESIKGLADRLQKNIPNMNRQSAIRAARTAVTGAQNAGRMDSYRAAEEMGIELDREWFATLDNRTRHAHRGLDRQRAKMNEPFRVDGHEIWYPGDSSAPGYLVYNCRCSLIVDVKDAPKSPNPLRRAEDPETGKSVLISDMSYAQWESWKSSENRHVWEIYQKKGRNYSADKNQYADYKAVLGKNAPKTFAEFQDLKYNDTEKWDFLKIDYARRNKLINHPELTLLGANTAQVPSAKFTGYLFNAEKPEGWAKGQAFTSRLGYSKENWKELQKEILQGAKRYPATPKLKDNFGQRFEQRMVLYGNTDRPANVVVGWIQKPDGTVSMTTAYIKEV